MKNATLIPSPKHVLLGSLVVAACAGKSAVTTSAAIPTAPPTATHASIPTAPSRTGADSSQAPRIFLHSPLALAEHKARWLAAGKPAEPALDRLLADAKKALAQKPFSVTEKSAIPPSGDKHDYLSLAPYFWPDPGKPNGLPYINRDGETNPERDGIPDHIYLARIATLTETLGLAYFFTGDENYAGQAVALLRVFFLDPATRMNPNLNYAQGVRGKEDGRHSGLIDSACLPRLVDGVNLLLPSAAWSAEDRAGIDGWFRDFLSWLRGSELGRKEGQAKNNHGTWYDVQVVALALATGQDEMATEILNFSRKRRIGREIEPDGQQPEELRRTKSWHYCLFNLQALVALANLGEAAGVDLWRYQTSDGRSITKAIDYLVPFALGEKPWTTQEIGGFHAEALWPIVHEAAFHLQDTRLAKIALRLGKDANDRLRLFDN